MMAVVLYLTHAYSDIMLATVYLAHLYWGGSLLVVVYLTCVCSGKNDGSSDVLDIYCISDKHILGTVSGLFNYLHDPREKHEEVEE